MDRRRRGSQLLKVVRSSRQRNKQYHHELSTVNRSRFLLYVLTKVAAAVSHEWFYRFVAQDKRLSDKLYRYFRKGHKLYRRGKKGKASTIRNAISIDDRPSIFGGKERLGDTGK